MTTPTLTPPRAPSLPCKKTTSFRVREASFGDGHVQRAQDGINAASVSYDLTWELLSVADADTLEAFFVARGGWQAFFYTVTGDVQRKYRCGPVVRSSETSGNLVTIAVTLIEVHDP